MRRWGRSLEVSLLLATLLFLPHHIRLAAGEAGGSGVMVVYDSLGLGTPNEGNVESLLRLLGALGVPASIHSMDDEDVGLRANRGLIVVRNAPELEDSYSRFEASELARYDGRYLHVGFGMPETYADMLGLKIGMSMAEPAKLTIGPIRMALLGAAGERLPYIAETYGHTFGRIAWLSTGRQTPFGAVNGTVATVPFFRADAASELAMAYVLKDWMQLPGEGKPYLLYKDIYPFTNLDLLKGTADALYAAGIPFIYSVRPVYANTDYPAMHRYLEALRVVQARNGAIFADAPNVSQVAGIQSENLAEKTELFLNVLGEAGVVPLGMGVSAELYWQAASGISNEGLLPFDTLVLYPPGRTAGLLRPERPAPRLFDSSMLAVRWSELGPYWEAGRRYPLPVDVAFVTEFYESEQEMKTAIQKLQDSWIPFADYKGGTHETLTSNHRMASKGGILSIDGEQVVFSRSEEVVNPDYDYRDEAPRSFERLFTVQNYIYLAIIGLSLVLFGVVLLVGYRIYKRKFMK
ncbi:hypothetical protein [Paenibacillus agaridevorans]|uniref:hypothetical protein n=1 Tax=Paenibacillus agaridevorans TaxID=171404 RepID=UPI001BE3D155|nr:hypothetical protein [Paenibacillus agaridevorans]